MAVGPRDLPPGKKQAVDGPPGPGDSPGTGESPSRSPVKDDAQISDSESDAFSSVQADMFVRGGVKAKPGRKVRTVKPRLGEHALMDWATMGRAIVVMKVSVGEDGRVTNVKVVRSSGSDSMDMETSLAVYRWWIEPKKGPDGVAVADNVTLTIVWH
jgi:TonB family protein